MILPPLVFPGQTIDIKQNLTTDSTPPSKKSESLSLLKKLLHMTFYHGCKRMATKTFTSYDTFGELVKDLQTLVPMS
jgi:hypothetical protein